MQVHAVVNGATLCALLDPGWTHNFMDTDVVAHVGITLHGCTGLRMAASNGDRVSGLGCCRNLRLIDAG
jgi:hypothetical protein